MSSIEAAKSTANALLTGLNILTGAIEAHGRRNVVTYEGSAVFVDYVGITHLSLLEKAILKQLGWKQCEDLTEMWTLQLEKR